MLNRFSTIVSVCGVQNRSAMCQQSSALTSLNDCDKIFDELISSMQRKQSEVKQLIKAQEKTATAQVEDHQFQLKEEITKLKRTYAELEKALDAHDLIYLMQV